MAQIQCPNCGGTDNIHCLEYPFWTTHKRSRSWNDQEKRDLSWRLNGTVALLVVFFAVIFAVLLVILWVAVFHASGMGPGFFVTLAICSFTPALFYKRHRFSLITSEPIIYEEKVLVGEQERGTKRYSCYTCCYHWELKPGQPQPAIDPARIRATREYLREQDKKFEAELARREASERFLAEMNAKKKAEDEKWAQDALEWNHWNIWNNPNN